MKLVAFLNRIPMLEFIKNLTVHILTHTGILGYFCCHLLLRNEKLIFVSRCILVGNLRSMGYLAPWLDFHWFNKFYLYVISLIYTTLAFVKKENSKRDIYKLVKPMEVNRTCIAWFHEFSLDVSSLIVTTSAFVKKERSKMKHLKNSKTNEGQIKEQDVPLT